HEELHRMGAPRVTTSIRMGTRTDRVQGLDDKVRSVEDKLT
ncbi:MAG: thiamine-binding protein, partial [Candidatus Cloacimonetes bacterium]|nr:thiamine-binding protein [Candidatus Cloacimonadota bacterium]